MRFLLGIVLLVSLWPVGMAASIATNWNDEPQGHASSNSEGSASVTAAPETSSETLEEASTSVGGDELRSIIASVHRLNTDLQHAELAKDESQPELASEAEDIVEELQSWRASYGAMASDSDSTAVSLLTTMAQSIERLASSPTKVTFNAYIEAVDGFNEFVESVPSG